MGARWWWALAGSALVLGVTGAPAPAPAQDSVQLARARQVLESYLTCERTRRFAPCWPLLSKRVQRDWADQGRGTVAEYAQSKSAEEAFYRDFRVLRIRKSPTRVVFEGEATGGGVRAGSRERAEYAVLREDGQWRIDGKRAGQWEHLP